MAKLNWEKQSRKERGVQRDGAYSSYGGLGPKKKKKALGYWSKHEGQWVIGVVEGQYIPEDKVIFVLKKSDGSYKPVRLLNVVGSKKLDHATLDLYSFAQVDDSLPKKS